MSQKIKVGIVGATGLVGLELKTVLAEYFPPADLEIHLFASTARTADRVHELSSSWDQVAKCDFLLNAASVDVAFELQRHLLPSQVLIDNSSAFRMDPEVFLVVPEVNGALLEAKPQIVANPNCTAILLCIALNALKSLAIQRVVVSTYQAASGAGLKGLEELDAQMKAYGRGEPLPPPQVFPYPLAGNVLSHNTSIRPEGEMGAGYNDEEWKVIEETRKILDIRHLAVTATCVRVPVKRAHTESVTVDLKKDTPLADIRTAFANAPGVKVVDDWEQNHFPMPIEAQNQDLVLVGRIRKDAVVPKAIHFMLSGDQLRKGAASNAVQILKQILTLR